MARFNLEDAAARVYEKAEEIYKGSEINSDTLARVVDNYFNKEYTVKQLQTIKDYFVEQEEMFAKIYDLEDNEDVINSYEESKSIKTEGLYDSCYKTNDREELKEIALNAIYVAHNDVDIINELLDRLGEDEKIEYIKYLMKFKKAPYDFVANNYTNMPIELLREIALNAVYIANDDKAIQKEIDDRKVEENYIPTDDEWVGKMKDTNGTFFDVYQHGAKFYDVLGNELDSEEVKNFVAKNIKTEGKKVEIQHLGEMENIAEDFVSYRAFRENFGDLIIIKNPYDKAYYLFNPEKTDYTDYIYFSSSRECIEGLLDGAVKANNGKFNDLKKGTLKEDKEIPYDNTTEKVCPKCGGKYTEYPALSRRDNKTYICPDCGVAEALEDFYGKKTESKDAIYVIGLSNHSLRAIAASTKDGTEEEMYEAFVQEIFNDEDKEDKNKVAYSTTINLKDAQRFDKLTAQHFCKEIEKTGKWKTVVATALADVKEECFEELQPIEEDNAIELQTTDSVLKDIAKALNGRCGDILSTKTVKVDDVVGLAITRKGKQDLITLFDTIKEQLSAAGIDPKDYEIDLKGDTLVLAMKNMTI